jgi:hypothetical protein
VLVGLVAPVFAGDVSVRGYLRRDGTYVQPHMRSAPDGNPYNNWSTKGNANPYTGQPGTRQPKLLPNNDSNNLSGFGSGYGLGGQRRGRSPWGND